MATTVYDINVRYRMDDKASGGLKKVGREAQMATRHTSELGGMLRRLAVGAIGFASFGLAKRLLIDYNSQLQQARITMSGLMQFNMGGEWARNQERANYLIERFREDAKASVGTTQDFVEMGKLVVKPFSKAALSVREIADATRGAVIASKAFGYEAGQAALDIDQMLRGMVGARDRFANDLLVAAKMTREEWNKMAKKDPAEAGKKLLKVLDSPTIKKLAAEQGKSWEGVVSTLEDNLQRAFGKVGLPLMERMSQEMENLTKWFDDNPERVAQIVQSMGDGLVRAFEAAKGAFGWIVEHKDLLLTLAKAALVSKGIGLVGGAVKGGIGMVTGTIDAFKKARGFITKANAAIGLLHEKGRAAARVLTLVATLRPGLMSAARSVGLFGAAVVAGVAIIKGIEHAAHKRLDARMDREAGVAFLKDRLKGIGGFKWNAKDAKRTTRLDSDARDAARLIREKGFVGKGGKLDEAKIAEQFFGPGMSKLIGSQELRDRAKSLPLGGGRGGAAARNMDLIIQQMNAALQLDAQQKKEAAFSETQARANHLKGMVSAFSMDFASRLQANKDFGGVLRSYLGGESLFGAITKKLMGGADIGDDRGKVAKSDHTTNVKISRIEVVSDDPDRFAFNLVGAFRDRNINAVQAKRTISEN